MEIEMVALGSVAGVLGLPDLDVASHSPFDLISRIEGGLPIGSLDRVAHILAPSDAQFKYRLVRKATYGRRKLAQQKLSSEEGTRLARVARVWGEALDVWGSDEEAREFLFRAHPMLEDKRPIDVVIQNEFGAEMVLDILGSLKYGSAA
jgi:putative toxin-antitoxin system antitoxin component (TIGR02293 family)